MKENRACIVLKSGEGGLDQDCPFYIPQIDGVDYCGYYGKDLVPGKVRLDFCGVEAVLEASEKQRKAEG